MKNVIFLVHTSPLLLQQDGHGNLSSIEIGPECCFGHQYRRKKYFQQSYANRGSNICNKILLKNYKIF